MATSLDDLTTPLTTDQATAAIYDVLATLGVDTTTWKPGAVVRTMIAAVAVLVASLSTMIALIARSGFLDLSAGDWLTLLAHYVYGVDRIVATFGTGLLTLTNTGGGVFDVDPGDLIVSNGVKSYTNSAAFHLGASTSISIPIVALESGSTSTTLATTITTLVTPLIGVTCSNTTAVVGADAELDPALRTRCRDKLGALSPNGPLDAYGFVGRSAVRADGTPIGVTRVRAVRDGMGGIDLYFATADGPILGVASDPSTDLGAIALAIQSQAEPLAVDARTHSATAAAIDVTYSVWMYNTSGMSVVDITTAISNALLAFMRSEPVGGNVIGVSPGAVYLSAIEAAIGGAVPGIFRVVLTAPTIDTPLSVSDVPTMGVVTPTAINQIPTREVV